MPHKIPGTDQPKGKRKKKTKKTLNALTEQTSHLSVDAEPSTHDDDSAGYSTPQTSPGGSHPTSPLPIPRELSTEEISGVPADWEDCLESTGSPKSSYTEAIELTGSPKSSHIEANSSTGSPKPSRTEATSENTSQEDTGIPKGCPYPKETRDSHTDHTTTILEKSTGSSSHNQSPRTEEAPAIHQNTSTDGKPILDGHLRSARTLESNTEPKSEPKPQDFPSDHHMEDPGVDIPSQDGHGLPQSTSTASAKTATEKEPHSANPPQNAGFWDGVGNADQAPDIEQVLASPDLSTTPLFSDIVRDVAPNKPVCPPYFKSQDAETEYRRRYLDWYRDANQRLHQQLHILRKNRQEVVKDLEAETERCEQLSAEIRKSRRDHQDQQRPYPDARNRRNKRVSPTPHGDDEEECQPKRAPHSVGSALYYEEINKKLGKAQHKEWLAQRYEMANQLPRACERPEFAQDGLVPNMYISHRFDTPLRKFFAPRHTGMERNDEDTESLNRRMQQTAEEAMAFWREVHVQRTDPTLGAMAYRCTPGEDITTDHLDFLPCYFNERSYRYRGVFFNSFQEAWIMDLAIHLGYDRETTESLRNHLRRVVNSDQSPAEKHVTLQKTLATVRLHPIHTEGPSKDGKQLGTTYAKERLEEAYYASAHWYEMLTEVITHQYAREPHLRRGRNILIQEALRAEKATKKDGRTRYPLFAFQLVGPEKCMFLDYLKAIPLHLGGAYRDFYGLVLTGVAIRLLKMRDENRIPFENTLPRSSQRHIPSTSAQSAPRYPPPSHPTEAPVREPNPRPRDPPQASNWNKPRKTSPQAFVHALEKIMPTTMNPYSPIAEKDSEEERD